MFARSELQKEKHTILQFRVDGNKTVTNEQMKEIVGIFKSFGNS